MLKRWTSEEDAIIIREGRKAVIDTRTANAVQGRYYYLVGCGEIPLKEKQVRWSDEETELLYALREQGKTFPEISKIMGRTLESVKSRHKNQRGKYPQGYDLRDEELLDLVRKYKVKNIINYKRLAGEPSAGVIERRFGSWSEAMKLAGVPINSGNLDLNKETLLYLIDFGHFKKIGITQKTVQERFRGFNFELLDLVKYDELIPAWETERELLDLVKPWKFKPIELIGNGATECFKWDECCDLLHPFQNS